MTEIENYKTTISITVGIHSLTNRYTSHDFADIAIEVQKHAEIILFGGWFLKNVLAGGRCIFILYRVYTKWWMCQNNGVSYGDM